MCRGWGGRLGRCDPSLAVAWGVGCRGSPVLAPGDAALPTPVSSGAMRGQRGRGVFGWGDEGSSVEPLGCREPPRAARGISTHG